MRATAAARHPQSAKNLAAVHGQSRRSDWQIFSCMIFNWDNLPHCLEIAFK
jgi:hypothetical protein